MAFKSEDLDVSKLIIAKKTWVYWGIWVEYTHLTYNIEQAPKPRITASKQTY